MDLRLGATPSTEQDKVFHSVQEQKGLYASAVSDETFFSLKCHLKLMVKKFFVISGIARGSHGFSFVKEEIVSLNLGVTNRSLCFVRYSR